MKVEAERKDPERNEAAGREAIVLIRALDAKCGLEHDPWYPGSSWRNGRGEVFRILSSDREEVWAVRGEREGSQVMLWERAGSDWNETGPGSWFPNFADGVTWTFLVAALRRVFDDPSIHLRVAPGGLWTIGRVVRPFPDDRIVEPVCENLGPSAGRASVAALFALRSTVMRLSATLPTDGAS
jgi:hypothetical protein